MKLRFLLLLSGTIFLLAKFSAASAQDRTVAIDPRPFADNANHWYGIADAHNVINALPGRPKYKSTQLREIGDNILLFQKKNGGWPKNYDVFAILSEAQKDSVLKAKDELNTTFDNGTGYTHITALSQVYEATGDEKYKQAALKGFDFILQAQYQNGGWPQYFPLQDGYSRHITFNDGAMIGIMDLLQDVVDGKPLFKYIDVKRRRQLKNAYSSGLDCILKTQINDAGKLTAWCQQHDEITLQPAWARKFEPPSICNGESVGVVLFLMNLDKPDARVINAVRSAKIWFDESKIMNTRVETVKGPNMKSQYRAFSTDRVVVRDTTAVPIWTRYYELKTHRPLFCNRDSKVVYSLAEVERERRVGYAWYTYNPQRVLDLYPAWTKRWNVK